MTAFEEPAPIDPEAPRYGPPLPFPPTRYLPGWTARPGTADLETGRSDERPWEESGATPLFRRGVDLYNRAYFWEAHEAWETLWHRCPPGTPLREGLQGLIQLAAALLKEHQGVPEGARKLSRTALERLERARAGDAALPLDLASLVARARGHFAPLDTPGAPVMPRPAIRLTDSK